MPRVRFRTRRTGTPECDRRSSGHIPRRATVLVAGKHHLRLRRSTTMSARLHAVSNGTRPAVEVTGLRKTYPGGIQAVRGINFQVAPGEVFGLLGPNGAGKSTTIGMLTTTIKPTSGSA